MSLRKYFSGSSIKPFNGKKIVVVTGCDSGLGFNMANLCQSLGLTVIAGCLSNVSSGARNLQKLKSIHVQELDITSTNSIEKLKSRVVDEIQKRDGAELYALVNNAGFMSFGEFEWLTLPQIRRHVEVNVLGTMNVTHALLPILRQQANGRRFEELPSRIINVTSHCSLVALPGLAPYAASKAGLSFYTSALRIELRKYHIKVLNFIPGSFVTQSGIMSKQREYSREMWMGLNEEQRFFYGDYFRTYNDHLAMVGEMAPKEAIDVNPKIIEAFRDAITANDPKRRYLVEPWRYMFYHNLFRILPDSNLRDDLIERFMNMPKYVPRR